MDAASQIFSTCFTSRMHFALFKALWTTKPLRQQILLISSVPFQSGPILGAREAVGSPEFSGNRRSHTLQSFGLRTQMQQLP